MATLRGRKTPADSTEGSGGVVDGGGDADPGPQQHAVPEAAPLDQMFRKLKAFIKEEMAQQTEALIEEWRLLHDKQRNDRFRSASEDRKDRQRNNLVLAEVEKVRVEVAKLRADIKNVFRIPGSPRTPPPGSRSTVRSHKKKKTLKRKMTSPKRRHSGQYSSSPEDSEMEDEVSAQAVEIVESPVEDSESDYDVSGSSMDEEDFKDKYTPRPTKSRTQSVSKVGSEKAEARRRAGRESRRSRVEGRRSRAEQEAPAEDEDEDTEDEASAHPRGGGRSRGTKRKIVVDKEAEDEETRVEAATSGSRSKKTRPTAKKSSRSHHKKIYREPTLANGVLEPEERTAPEPAPVETSAADTRRSSRISPRAIEVPVAAPIEQTPNEPTATVTQEPVLEHSEPKISHRKSSSKSRSRSRKKTKGKRNVKKSLLPLSTQGGVIAPVQDGVIAPLQDGVPAPTQDGVIAPTPTVMAPLRHDQGAELSEQPLSPTRKSSRNRNQSPSAATALTLKPMDVAMTVAEDQVQSVDQTQDTRVSGRIRRRSPVAATANATVEEKPSSETVDGAPPVQQSERSTSRDIAKSKTPAAASTGAAKLIDGIAPVDLDAEGADSRRPRRRSALAAEKSMAAADVIYNFDEELKANKLPSPGRLMRRSVGEKTPAASAIPANHDVDTAKEEQNGDLTRRSRKSGRVLRQPLDEGAEQSGPPPLPPAAGEADSDTGSTPRKSRRSTGRGADAAPQEDQSSTPNAPKRLRVDEHATESSGRSRRSGLARLSYAEPDDVSSAPEDYYPPSTARPDAPAPGPPDATGLGEQGEEAAPSKRAGGKTRTKHTTRQRNSRRARTSAEVVEVSDSAMNENHTETLREEVGLETAAQQHGAPRSADPDTHEPLTDESPQPRGVVEEGRKHLREWWGGMRHRLSSQTSTSGDNAGDDGATNDYNAAETSESHHSPYADPTSAAASRETAVEPERIQPQPSAMESEQPAVKNLPLKMRIRISRISEQEAETRAEGTDAPHVETSDVTTPGHRKGKRSKSLLGTAMDSPPGGREILVGSLVHTNIATELHTEEAVSGVVEESVESPSRGRRKAKRLASVAGGGTWESPQSGAEKSEVPDKGLINESSDISPARSLRARKMRNEEPAAVVVGETAAEVEPAKVVDESISGSHLESPRLSRSRGRRTKAEMKDYQPEVAMVQDSSHVPEVESDGTRDDVSASTGSEATGSRRSARRDRKPVQSHVAGEVEESTAMDESAEVSTEDVEGSVGISENSLVVQEPAKKSHKSKKAQRAAARKKAKQVPQPAVAAAVPKETEPVALENDAAKESSPQRAGRRELRARKTRISYAEEYKEPEEVSGSDTSAERKPRKAARTSKAEAEVGKAPEEDERETEAQETVYEAHGDGATPPVAGLTPRTARSRARTTRPPPTEDTAVTPSPRRARGRATRSQQQGQAAQEIVATEAALQPEVEQQSVPEVEQPVQRGDVQSTHAEQIVPDVPQEGDAIATSGGATGNLIDEDAKTITDTSSKEVIPTAKRAPARKKGRGGKKSKARKPPPAKAPPVADPALEAGPNVQAPQEVPNADQPNTLCAEVTVHAPNEPFKEGEPRTTTATGKSTGNNDRLEFSSDSDREDEEKAPVATENSLVWKPAEPAPAPPPASVETIPQVEPEKLVNVLEPPPPPPPKEVSNVDDRQRTGEESGEPATESYSGHAGSTFGQLEEPVSSKRPPSPAHPAPTLTPLQPQPPRGEEDATKRPRIENESAAEKPSSASSS